MKIVFCNFVLYNGVFVDSDGILYLKSFGIGSVRPVWMPNCKTNFCRPYFSIQNELCGNPHTLRRHVNSPIWPSRVDSPRISHVRKARASVICYSDVVKWNWSGECPLIPSKSVPDTHLPIWSPGDSLISTSKLVSIGRWMTCLKVGTSNEELRNSQLKLKVWPNH